MCNFYGLVSIKILCCIFLATEILKYNRKTNIQTFCEDVYSVYFHNFSFLLASSSKVVSLSLEPASVNLEI